MLTGSLMVRLAVICIGATPPAGHAAQNDVDDRTERLLESVVRQWHYPNTESDVGGGTYSVRTSVQRCRDDYQTVWTHYVRKCGFDFEYGATKFYRFARKSDDAVFVWDDRHKFVDKLPRRSKTFFVCNAADYSVAGIISPQDGAPPIIHMTIAVRPAADVRAPPGAEEDAAEGDAP